MRREVVGIGIIAPLTERALGLDPGKAKIERAGNPANDLVLPGGNLIPLKRKSLGPEMASGLRLDQPDIDADLIPRLDAGYLRLHSGR